MALVLGLLAAASALATLAGGRGVRYPVVLGIGGAVLVRLIALIASFAVGLGPSSGR
ncbi:MAG TPA: hypothetical protein VMF57_12215 [Solirubrobacteraceae bacterium]|nr:hypothetical protein [Solirubrobacteraceae bacterium]